MELTRFLLIQTRKTLEQRQQTSFQADREREREREEKNYIGTIFSAGSMAMATFMKSWSRNGTRASKPQADVDLLALKQSYMYRALICCQTGQSRVAIKPWRRILCIRDLPMLCKERDSRVAMAMDRSFLELLQGAEGRRRSLDVTLRTVSLCSSSLLGALWK